MKKIFLILFSICFLFLPIRVYAKSLSFEGYYCDPKQDLGDGTFYMTCHIVATSDYDINQVKGKLVLKNVTLESIKTHDDWTSNNGLSTDDNFTAKTGHSGTFTIADLVYTGNLSDKECEASFMPEGADYEKPQDFVCMIVDDAYYGKNGSIVSKEEYYEQCCNYVCTIVDGEYYFDSKGQSVSYDEMIEDCKETDVIIDNPQTGINYGYILLPIGIVSIILIIRIAKKNTKIYKI